MTDGRAEEAREHELARLVVAVVRNDAETLRALRRGAGEALLADRVRSRAWREAMLQATLFAGFPGVIAAWTVLDEEGGLGAPDPYEALVEPAELAAGRAPFERVYGGSADAVFAVLRGHHPLLARWVLDHAYGRVLGRPGLAPRTRELLSVAMLAATGLDRQLASHARGAARLGATPTEVRGVLDAIADLAPPDDLARAREVVAAFAR